MAVRQNPPSTPRAPYAPHVISEKGLAILADR